MPQTVPNPRTALVRAQNARAVARRASLSALSQSMGRTGFARLSRNAPQAETIGGSFEELVPEPAEVQLPSSEIPSDLVNRFFQALTLRSQQQIVPRRFQMFPAGSPPALLQQQAMTARPSFGAAGRRAEVARSRFSARLAGGR